ncbi:MAG: disulfide bond formation protein B [Rhodocyclaceae bacterium]|nr:disulfide bond formation protein B [Rhodocyclaceae bacterium]
MLRFPRLIFLGLAAAGLGAFFGGVLLGNLMHLAACPLCILQRMLYLLVGVLGLLGVALAHKPLPSRIVAALTAATAVTGAGIAVYQTWLQHHPEGPSCTADTPWWEDLVYWAGQQAPDFFLSSGMCSDPGFMLFGLTIANYSVVLFGALALAALAVVLRRR